MKIILASASPRRKELLEQLGLTFLVFPAQGEEKQVGDTPSEIVMNLAKQKAGEIYEKMIENALGRSVDLTGAERRTPCMSRLLMSPVDGTISSIDNDKLDALRAEGNVIALDYAEGEAVEKMYNGTTRIGHLIARTDDVEDVDKIMNGIYSAIYVDGTSMEELWAK